MMMRILFFIRDFDDIVLKFIKLIYLIQIHCVNKIPDYYFKGKCIFKNILARSFFSTELKTFRKLLIL